MARTKTRIQSQAVKPKVYLEGKHEKAYLKALQRANLITAFEHGTPTDCSDIPIRIHAIKNDLSNGYETVIWIVDLKDEHIKQSQEYQNFYNHWQENKDKPKSNLRRLHILKNDPCFEFWFLLHRTSCHKSFVSGTDLYASNEFKTAFPNFDKDHSRIMDVFIQKIANQSEQRELAKRHAEQLAKNPELPQAEIYKIFDLLKINSNR